MLIYLLLGCLRSPLGVLCHVTKVDNRLDVLLGLVQCLLQQGELLCGGEDNAGL